MSSINEIKIKLEEIADNLYKGNINKGMSQMNGVIPSIADMASGFGEELQERLINDALVPALAAMEDNDGVMLADIISYELITLLEEL